MRKRRWAALAVAVGLLSSGPAAAQTAPAAGGWVTTLSVAGISQYISAFPDGSAFLWDAAGTGSRFYVSSDFGLTWSETAAPPDHGDLGGFEMADPKRGVLVTGDVVYGTSDGAASWQELPAPKLPGPRWEWEQGDTTGYKLDLYSVTFAGSAKRAVLGGELSNFNRRFERPDGSGCSVGPSNAVVLRAVDGGRSGDYRYTRLPFRGWVDEIGFHDRNNGWLIGTHMQPEKGNPCRRLSQRNIVMVTKDGGKTYRAAMDCPHIQGGTGDHLACMAVGMATPKWFVVGHTDGTTHITKNGGRSFEPGPDLVVPNPGGDTHYRHAFWVDGIEFADAKVGYAYAHGGGTWRTDDGGESWTFEASTQSVYGIGMGDLAVADAGHAIAGGPNAVVTRIPAAPPR